MSSPFSTAPLLKNTFAILQKHLKPIMTIAGVTYFATTLVNILVVLTASPAVGLAASIVQQAVHGIATGVIALARITGAPILPLAFGAYPAWRLRSWDEFLIPKPFARAAVCFGPPLWVPAGADRSQQEALRKELEVQLSQLTWRADALIRET